MKKLFYVRRHTCADGSFEWYVRNGHTLRRVGKPFPTRAKAEAERGDSAGEARSGQGASPQANARRLSADAAHDATDLAVACPQNLAPVGATDNLSARSS
jgi:hypothetical protein